MEYKAKHVDTNKALKYLDDLSADQIKNQAFEIVKVQERYKGRQEGLDMAREIFTCSNCESDEMAPEAIIDHVIYELAKELDIPAQDIREQGGSVDEICAKLAERINENKKACWKHSEYGFCKCSSCGYTDIDEHAVKVDPKDRKFVDLIWHFCPNCGAEMYFDNENY